MKNITPEQKELLDRLYARDPDLEIEWDDVRGVAASIRGHLGLQPSMEPGGKLQAFLEKFGPLVGPPGLAAGLKPLRQMSDEVARSGALHVFSPEAAVRRARPATVDFSTRGWLLATKAPIAAPMMVAISNGSACSTTLMFPPWAMNTPNTHPSATSQPMMTNMVWRNSLFWPTRCTGGCACYRRPAGAIESGMRYTQSGRAPSRPTGTAPGASNSRLTSQPPGISRHAFSSARVIDSGRWNR